MCQCSERICPVVILFVCNLAIPTEKICVVIPVLCCCYPVTFDNTITGSEFLKCFFFGHLFGLVGCLHYRDTLDDPPLIQSENRINSDYFCSRITCQCSILCILIVDGSYFFGEDFATDIQFDFVLHDCLLLVCGRNPLIVFGAVQTLLFLILLRRKSLDVGRLANSLLEGIKELIDVFITRCESNECDLLLKVFLVLTYCRRH